MTQQAKRSPNKTGADSVILQHIHVDTIGFSIASPVASALTGTYNHMLSLDTDALFMTLRIPMEHED